MLAKDIMTKGVLSVQPDTDLAQIATLLHKHRISAVPVLDDEQKLLGIVSEGDLLRREELGTERQRSWWLWLFMNREQEAHDYTKSHARKAVDIMTSDVITVSEDVPVREIATLLENHHIKRVPVIRAGKVVGIVSRANLIQGLAARKPDSQNKNPAIDEAAMRDNIIKRLHNDLGLGFASVNVIVENQTVYLWGLVNGKEERKAIRVIAENTPGILQVKNHLGIAGSMGVHTV